MGCAKKNMETGSAIDVTPSTYEPTTLSGKRPVGMILKATAFQMSGDYSNNVAINLNEDGTINYYPAPSDITENSRPVALEDGWWLNRQGLGPNSVFLRYTFDEYMALPAAPSLEELKAAIIPGARVTAFRRLSYPAGEAMKYLPQIKEELK